MNQSTQFQSKKLQSKQFQSKQVHTTRKRWLSILMVFGIVLSSLLPLARLAQPAAAAPSRMIPIFEELSAVGDARTQAGSPDANFGDGFLWTSTPNGHYVFIEFDLSVLPVDAVIETAELRLDYVNVDAGPATVEVGRVDGAWDETTLTWNTQPAITGGGPAQTVDATGIVGWDVTGLVEAWVDGSQPNYGFVLRGQDGILQATHSKETGVAPKLVVSYNIEEVTEPRPDLGDAPDSSNHHGQDNTAYNIGPILGQFPTVWEVPTGQVAGPRHLNQSYEGYLGQSLSREIEADQGADADGPNNILRGAGGAIGDVADNDRGDDGWRNRNIKFFDCRERTLTIRVSKAAPATKARMYLNVWFDGNRDGDWADVNPCQPDPSEPNQASYEWIVQDHIVDMTAIPAGGYLDFDIDTELVYNATPGQGHWMRFTLSEDRAVQPGGNAYPDGRGPHPDDAKPSFQHGETEDIFQRRQPQGQDGTLTIEKRVLTEAEPVSYAGAVTYEILLTNEGGTQPIQAEIRDELPYPLHVNRQIDEDGNIFVIETTSATGGASPLTSVLDYNVDPVTGIVTQEIGWTGTLEPDAQVKLSFEVHVHPICGPTQNTITLQNIAQALPDGGDPIEAIAEFEAACAGYSASDISLTREVVGDVDERIFTPGFDSTSVESAGVDMLPIQSLKSFDKPFRERNVFKNNSDSLVKIGIVSSWHGCLTCTIQAASVAQVSGVDEHQPGHYTQVHEMQLEPGESKSWEQLVNPQDLLSDSGFDVGLEPINMVGELQFCLLADHTDQCPDAELYPYQIHIADPLEIEYRPADLGDAPDSSNHTAGAAGNMTAYPAVQANFPTVFDAATGLPQGPLHRHPRGLHLGRRVSREAEADIGPDEDPFNNINPAGNVPNLDRGDDGIRPGLLGFVGCQVATFQVSVFAHPAMLAKLQEKQIDNVYLNSWIDGIDDAGTAGGDGDWADELSCPNGPAPEHIVIDFIVPVNTLAAGVNIINVTTSGPVPWNGQQAAWFRISLSEIQSVKLAGKTYGDGQGPATGFRIGETEDYLLPPQGAAGDGPDLAVELTGSVDLIAKRPAGVQAADVSMVEHAEQRKFKIRTFNQGSQTAKGATLRFNIPDELSEGTFDIKAPGITDDKVTLEPSGINFFLPDMAPGARSTIILGWTGCLTCTVSTNVTAASPQMDMASAKLTLAADVNPDNDESSWTSGNPQFPATIGFLTRDGLPYPRQNALTCQSPSLYGNGFKANSNVFVHITAAIMETVTTDAVGSFLLPLNLTGGEYDIRVEHEEEDGLISAASVQNSMAVNVGEVNAGGNGALRLRIDEGLALDPMSLRIVDPNGLVVMPDPAIFRNGGQNVTFPGFGRFDISAEACPNANVRSVGFALGDDYSRASLADGDCGSDDCGPWGAKLNIPEVGSLSTQAASVDSAANAIPFSMIITTDDSKEIIESAIEVVSTGTVLDAATSQPLENASVTLLQSLGDGTTAAFATWDGSALGQGNPQMTDATGHYAYSGPDGTLRLSVARTGYQPYSTEDFESAGGVIERNIQLSPVVTAEATHVVEISESGFAPAYLAVRPGSIVEFVNVDLADHTAAGSAWDSGLLAAGDAYKVQLDAEGSFNYEDAVGGSSATITVDPNAPEATVDEPGDEPNDENPGENPDENPDEGTPLADDPSNENGIFLPIVLK